MNGLFFRLKSDFRCVKIRFFIFNIRRLCLPLSNIYTCMVKRIVYIFALVVLFASCSEYNQIIKSNDIEKKYQYAKKCFEEKKYNRAHTILEGIITMFKGTARGEESLYLLAQSCYYDNDYATASQYFLTYCKNYPRGEYAELARFYAGYGYFLDSPDVRLDQTMTYKGLSELQTFLEYYPKSEKAEQAQKALIELQEKLVQKELLNVRLYYNLGNFMHVNHYRSAVVTARNALKDYPYTKHKEEFYYVILQSRHQEALNSVAERRPDRYREVVDEYYNYINEFPNGKYLKDAQAIFAQSNKYLKD